jgi:hypothetical protein
MFYVGDIVQCYTPDAPYHKEVVHFEGEVVSVRKEDGRPCVMCDNNYGNYWWIVGEIVDTINKNYYRLIESPDESKLEDFL